MAPLIGIQLSREYSVPVSRCIHLHSLPPGRSDPQPRPDRRSSSRSAITQTAVRRSERLPHAHRGSTGPSVAKATGTSARALSNRAAQRASDRHSVSRSASVNPSPTVHFTAIARVSPSPIIDSLFRWAALPRRSTAAAHWAPGTPTAPFRVLSAPGTANTQHSRHHRTGHQHDPRNDRGPDHRGYTVAFARAGCLRGPVRRAARFSALAEH